MSFSSCYDTIVSIQSSSAHISLILEAVLLFVSCASVGSKLFTPAATWIFDRHTGIQRVLTAHSEEGKVGSHVANAILKHSRKHNRTYQPSNRKYRVKIRHHTSQALTAGGCKPDD